MGIKGIKFLIVILLFGSIIYIASNTVGENDMNNNQPKTIQTAAADQNLYAVDESSLSELQNHDSTDDVQNTDLAVIDAEEKNSYFETLVLNIKSNELVNPSFQLAVPYISQYPELPTGCEVVSLTMLLNYLGYSVEKTDIADNCLVYGDSFVTSYLGSPYEDNGAGIYPPGVDLTVESFSKKYSADAHAVDLTGTSLSDLYKYIENGYPVMIWTTILLYEPMYDEEYLYEEYNGIQYPWYLNEHCVLLTGYDKKAGTVDISDPIYGELTYDADYFSYIYDEIGRFSLTVINKE